MLLVLTFGKLFRCILVRESNFYTDKSALLCHALLNPTLQFYSTLSLTQEGERNVKLKNAVKRWKWGRGDVEKNVIRICDPLLNKSAFFNLKVTPSELL